MLIHNISKVEQVLQNFEFNLTTFLSSTLGKRSIVWQDVFDLGRTNLLDAHSQLPTSTIIDVWAKEKEMSIDQATQRGHDVIVSSCWYLDISDYDWWKFYSCRLRGGSPPWYTKSQMPHILGGHACMWAEQVDASNFMELVWPRTAAAAEVLWSGDAPLAHRYDTRIRSSVQERLEVFRCWMVRNFEIPIAPLGPGYCAEANTQWIRKRQSEPPLQLLQ
jgi:hexosaminidase